MKKDLIRPTRWATLLLCSLLLPAIIMNSCRKMESTVTPDQQNFSKFFALPANASDALKYLAADLTREDDAHHFVSNFIKRFGYPAWDKTLSNVPIIATDNGQKTLSEGKALYLLPFKIPGGSVSAYLAVYQNNNEYHYALYTRPGLVNALNRETDPVNKQALLSKLMVTGYFEQVINNKSTAELAGKRYDNISVNIHTAGGVTGGASSGNTDVVNIIVTVCQELLGFKKGGNNNTEVAGAAGNQTLFCHDEEVFIWVNDGAGGNGGNTNNGSGDGGYNSGGGTSGYTCPPDIWYCASGDFRILDGAYVTPNDYPGKDDGAPWLWWENLETLLPEFDNSIKDSLASPCLSKVLSEIKGIKNGKIGEIINKFSGTLPLYNWKIKNGTLPQHTQGRTNNALDNGYVVTFLDSNQLKKATDMAIAATIMHESIHAYLVSYFRFDPAKASLDYPTLIHEWEKSKHPNLNDVQHNEMTRSFVNEIATALKEYGISKGYILTDEFYEDMAWGGLQSTKAFQDLAPDDQVRIQNRLSAELLSQPFDTEFPLGKSPC